jgi:hypothetical protein
MLDIVYLDAISKLTLGQAHALSLTVRNEKSPPW